MNQDKYVFAQLVEFLNNDKFRRLVDRYATFPWAKFRKRKAGVKAHVLYDIEAQVPVFYTVTTVSQT